MATRSGAGTGVIVALVVFVLTTLCLLVLTLVFYADKTKALDQASQARADLDRFVTREQRGREEVKALEDAASGARTSVVGLLIQRWDDMGAMVGGTRGATLAQLRSDLRIGDSEVVRDVLNDLRRQVQARTGEVNTLKARLDQQQADMSELQTRIAQLQEGKEQIVAGIDDTISGYVATVKQLEDGFRDNLDASNRGRIEAENEWQGRFSRLQSETDHIRADNALMGDRVRQLQQFVDAMRIKPRNPAELVDGRVVDVGTDNTVYIDLGARDRVVLGMTFEVFEDENSIQIDPRTGEQTRGKASIQITRVGDKTSTAVVTRSAQGRPVVRGNVIANAVFDPKHRFRFLVHGRFDVDGSGRPTAAGADFVRARIIEWGGELVEGDELTGDLDFLVLGTQPPMPPPLPPNAEIDRFNQYIELLAARDRYDTLFRQAREAQIPVLNWNRFEVLTGQTSR
ncbi:MAG TPA: hypothetical protein PKC43_07600 [Phycisphaerales bacterium]|nr:hypothetical protein [Phycisphaerales bacterium]HMP37300.1 hypothetical protein [Phycisphaerales bacterium]